MKRLVTAVDSILDALRCAAGWVLFPFALVLCAFAVLFTREG